LSPLGKNILINFLGRTWSAFLGVVLIPIHIKFIGIEAYGLVGFFATLSSVFGILDLGIGSTINRELARRSVNMEYNSQRDLVRSLEIIYWAIAIIAGFIVFLAAPGIAKNWIIAKDLPMDAVTNAVKLMGIGIAIQFPTSLYTGGLMGLQRQVLVNNILLITGTLKGLGTILILRFVSPTVESFFIWQIISGSIAIIFLCFSTWRALPVSSLPAKFNKSIIKEIWKYAAALSMNSLIGVMLSQLDKIILSKLLPLSAFAYYSIASTIGSVIWLIQIPINNAVFPDFVQIHESGDKKKAIDLYHKSSQILSTILIPISSILIFFSGPILYIWLRDADIVKNSHLLVSLIIFGLLLNAIASIPSSCASAFGWPQLVAYTNMFQAILIAPLMFIFIHLFEVTGAAIVYILMNSTYVVFLAPLLIKRYFKGQSYQWFIFDVGIPVLISFSLCFLSSKLMPQELTLPSTIIWITITGFIVLIATGFSLPAIRNYIFSFNIMRFTKI